MLLPDQPLALREMVRVTKPGGRVLLIAYGSSAEFEALQFFLASLQAVVPRFEGLPNDPPPLEFQVADPDVLRQRMTDAGLRNVTVDTALIMLNWSDPTCSACLRCVRTSRRAYPRCS